MIPKSGNRFSDKDHAQSNSNSESDMTTASVGAAKLTRIEETYEPNFEARTFFTDWRDEIVAPHLGWMVPNHFDPASGRLKLSIHSWLLDIGGGERPTTTP